MIDDNKKYIGLIANGVNIDHIPCGNAWYVIKILQLEFGNNQIGVGLNLPSKKLGIKDLIKISDKELTLAEIEKISLFCVNSSISKIRNYQVVEKQQISLPKVINQLIKCPNHRCISSQCDSKFITHTNHNEKIYLTCHYCEQVYLLSELNEYNI